MKLEEKDIFKSLLVKTIISQFAIEIHFSFESIFCVPFGDRGKKWSLDHQNGSDNVRSPGALLLRHKGLSFIPIKILVFTPPK